MLTKYPTVRYTLIYATVAFVGVFAFFYICDLLATRPAALSDNPVVHKLARVAYRGAFVSIQYTPECGRYDERLTYLLRPGECQFERAEYDTTVEVNSFGLRDDERSLDRPEILVLGDSHAMGLGVSAEASFPGLIERTLGRKTLNAGVSSFGTARELMLLQRLDRRLDLSALDYVVLQYCDNDFRENVAYATGGGKLDIKSKSEYQGLVRLEKRKGDSPIVPGLYVIRRATEKAWHWMTGPKADSSAAREADAFYFAIEANKELLRGRQLIILEVNGYNKNDDDFIERVRERFEDSELDPHFVRSSDFLTDDDYFRLDNHMRPSGHRKVADAVSALIQRIDGGYDVASVRP